MKKLLVICIAICICLSLISCDRSLSPTLDDLLESSSKESSSTEKAEIKNSEKEEAEVSLYLENLKQQTIKAANEAKDKREEKNNKNEAEEIKSEESINPEDISIPDFESMPIDLYGSKEGITDSVLSRGENTQIAIKKAEEILLEEGENAQIKQNEMLFGDMLIYTAGGSIFVSKTDENGNVQTYEKNILGDKAAFKKLLFDENSNLWFITEAGENEETAGVIKADYFTGEKDYMTVLLYPMTPDEKVINDIKALKNGVCVLTDKAFYTFDIKEEAITCDIANACEAKEGTLIAVTKDLAIFAGDTLYATDLKTGKTVVEEEIKDIVKNALRPIVYSAKEDEMSVILVGEGAARIDIINEGGRYETQVIWQREDILSNASPVLSTANSSIYTYTFNGKEYGFDSLAFKTGKSILFTKVSALESYAAASDITVKGNAIFVDTPAGTVSLADKVAMIEESPVYSFEAGSVDVKTITDKQFLDLSSRAYTCVSPALCANADVSEPVTINFIVDGFGIDKKDCKLFYMGSDGKFAFLPSWNIKHLNGPYLLKNAHIDKDKQYILSVFAKDGSIIDTMTEEGKLGVCIVAVKSE